MHAASLGLVRSTWQRQSPPFPRCYILRLSAQASYNHLSTRLGPKAILRQWTPTSATPSWSQCRNTCNNKSQVSVVFIMAAVPGLWHTCGYLTEAHKVQCYSRWCWLALAVHFLTQSSPFPSYTGEVSLSTDTQQYQGFVVISARPGERWTFHSPPPITTQLD